MKDTRLYMAILMLSAMLAACNMNPQKADAPAFGKAVYQPQYASGFSIMGAEDRESVMIRISDPWQNAEGIRQELLILRNGEQIPEGFKGQVLNGNATRIVCMSSSYVAMLDALDKVGTVVGVSGKNYISNTYIREHSDNIKDIGYEGNIDYESLVSIKPDIVFLYGISGPSSMELKLKELGIPYVYFGEYVEESPLGKAEWLVVAGEIIGERKKAEQIYSYIPTRYNDIKKLVSDCNEKPSVMLNLPYGDNWLMPSDKSYMVRLIEDAGGKYIFSNPGRGAVSIENEEAFSYIMQADFWLNTGQISSIKELESQYPKYMTAPCIKNRQIYNCNKRMSPDGGNDFWESGIINPDIILRDIASILHPEIMGKKDLFYYKKIE